MAEPLGGSSSVLPKQVADRIGRNFNLLFNRAVMYHLDHPSTVQSISEFYRSLIEGLSFVSPLTIIMERDQVFVEDEALDSRVNPFRLVAHFKKGGIQSISFGKGLKEEEISQFMKVFIHQKSYPTADAIKKAIPRFGVHNILVNHIVYKKVAADERIVSRKEEHKRAEHDDQVISATVRIQKPTSDLQVYHRLKNLTLDLLLTDPLRFSRELVEAEISIQSEARDAGKTPTTPAIEQLKILREEIIGNRSKVERKGLEEAFLSVRSMKKGIVNAINSRREAGLHFEEEEEILKEVDDLSDQVIVKLIKEEYQRGEVSLKRLGQILRRMIPDVKELRRLLPKIKEALVGEGMALSEYLELIKELGKELQEDGVVEALHEGAIEIGLTADEIIREIRKNPKEAAELIALAAEIRSQGKEGDQRILTDILVEYVEKVSAQIALDEAEKEGSEGGGRLKEIIERVELELLERLRARNTAEVILEAVKSRLMERRDGKLANEVMASWILRKIPIEDPSILDSRTITNVLRSSFEEEVDPRPVVELVKNALERHGWDRSRIDEICDAVFERIEEGKKEGLTRLPRGVLTRNQFLFILQGEIKKAARYPYPVSILTLRIVGIRPKRLVPIGSIRKSDVLYAVLDRLMKIKRDVDYAGVLNDERITLIMPFTNEEGAGKAMGRIMEALTEDDFTVNGIPVVVEIHPSTYSLEPYHKISVKAFIQMLDRDSKS